MSLKRKLLAGGGVILVVLAILASMNIAMYQKVLDNLSLRDEERRAHIDIKKHVEWKNNLNRFISEMVATGHVPPITSMPLSPPVSITKHGEHSSTISHEARTLIRLVKTKSDKHAAAEKQFEASRKEVTHLYHELDREIATVLAVIQMEQVLGRNLEANEEKLSLAPYVLKSLNQLTLIALNTLVTRQVSWQERQKVALNKQFLASQLHIVDNEGFIDALFQRLFKQLETIDRLIPETKQERERLDEQITKHAALFKQSINADDVDRLVLAAEDKVQSADEALETTSRNILIASIVFLFGVPLLLILTGVHRLNRLIVYPILELMKKMKEFEGGQLETEADASGPDEIGVLSRSFNAMARQIRAKVGELAFLNRALTEKETRLKAIFESSGNPIAVCDTNENLQYVNPAFTDVFGWTLDEIKGKSFRFFISETNRTIADEHFHELYRSRNSVKFSDRWLAQNGRSLAVIVSAALISRAEEESIQGVVINLTDISEQKSLEAQLVQAQKMESVGRLAGGVAHDYNNMLAVIVGRTDMAIEKTPPEHPLYDDLCQILKAATRSIDITRQLLAFSRKQTISPQRLNFNETIESMLKMLRHLIGENIDLNWRPGNRTGNVFMDASQIDQLLMNLCVNARDAITGTGAIGIETDTVVFNREYCAGHPECLVGEFVLLSVSDTGCGMDKETQKQIFEPFFTTKPRGEGTGLGLSTVYGIVKQNNGFINCYSEPGHGTTFRIYIPRCMTEAEKQPLSYETEELSASGNETILLVEDEKILLEMTSVMLTQLGYAVLPAATTDEAIAFMEKNAQTIDLLITDVVMPGLDGKELAETLLSIRNDIQVLFISGYPADVISHHGFVDDDVNFLSKPFTRKDLAAKVKETIHGGPII